MVMIELDLLRQALIVSVHCPLTPDTNNIIDARAIALMPDGSYLVNTARGATVGVVTDSPSSGSNDLERVREPIRGRETVHLSTHRKRL